MLFKIIERKHSFTYIREKPMCSRWFMLVYKEVTSLKPNAFIEMYSCNKAILNYSVLIGTRNRTYIVVKRLFYVHQRSPLCHTNYSTKYIFICKNIRFHNITTFHTFLTFHSFSQRFRRPSCLGSTADELLDLAPEPKS